MTTINLLRKSGTIIIQTIRPATIPSELLTNLGKISVSELKKICILWNINKKGKTKSADIQEAIISEFNTEHTNIKKDKGQFNTKNASYIFQNMTLHSEPNTIIDPCAGDGDLIAYICNKLLLKPIVKMYDCDPSKSDCETRDTLTNPVDYGGSLLMMNPPYLSNVQNKSQENAIIYANYGKDDLFKCYIQTMIINPPNEFIIIVPLNFLCSIRLADRNLRREFFRIFAISRINIFNEQVFADTTYNVCSIHGISGRSVGTPIATTIYPQKHEITLELSEENNYLIGGEIYKLPESKHTVGRAITEKANNVSNLYLKAIDDSIKVNLSIKEHPKDKSFGKVSDRSYAWITLKPMLSESEQLVVSQKFNDMLSVWRNKYHSLFLTNFRDNGRKRISFDLAFRIISHIISLGFNDDYDFPEIFTKEARNRIIGSNTKGNICEKWQIKQLLSIGAIEDSITGTNIRINHITYEISKVDTGLFNTLEFADWSEDFDIIANKYNKTHYFNLKFICESGGSQNRSIRPLANMIYYIAKHIEKTKCDDKIFIFITDGKYLMNFVTPNKQNSVSQFHWQIDRVNPIYRKYFFIGSTKQYISHVSGQ